MERKRITREEARLRMQPILNKYNSLPDVIHPKAEFRKQMAEALKGVLIPGIAPHEATILNYVSGKTAPEYEETMAALEKMVEEEPLVNEREEWAAKYGLLVDEGTPYGTATRSGGNNADGVQKRSAEVNASGTVTKNKDEDGKQTQG